MVKKGIVKKIIAQQAWVQILKDVNLDEDELSSSCSCSSCAGCHTRQDHFLVDLNIDVQIGAEVELYLETYRLVLLVFVSFALPVIALIIALWLSRNMGNSLTKWGLILSFLAFSLLFAYIFDKFYKARVRVVRVLEKDLANE